MAESHVISGLTAKRAELSGRIKQLKGEIDDLEAQLHHIDGAIKIFNPDYDLRGIRPRIKRDKNPLFDHGELNQLILDVMRTAQTHVTIRELYDAIVTRKGLDGNDDQERAIQKAIDKRLRNLEKSHIVKIAGIEQVTGANQWQVK